MTCTSCSEILGPFVQAQVSQSCATAIAGVLHSHSEDPETQTPKPEDRPKARNRNVWKGTPRTFPVSPAFPPLPMP